MCFPERVKPFFMKFLSVCKKEDITEIRMRADSLMSVTYSGKNVVSFGGREIYFDEAELKDIISKLCEESVHTYGKTLKDGFITISGGLRIGVCGHAVVESGKTVSVRDITSVCIRIPHAVYGVCSDVLKVISPVRTVFPTLFYSPPGEGKTTVIRDIALSLSSDIRRLRVCVVDTRSEIYMKDMFSHTICDFLDGYPKGEGIEIATRTLSPEVIICDEIGDASEASAIMSAQSSGVPLIATAHASDISGLLERPNIKMLYDAKIFRFLIKITRHKESGKTEFDVFDSWRTRN